MWLYKLLSEITKEFAFANTRLCDLPGNDRLQNVKSVAPEIRQAIHPSAPALASEGSLLRAVYVQRLHYFCSQISSVSPLWSVPSLFMTSYLLDVFPEEVLLEFTSSLLTPLLPLAIGPPPWGNNSWRDLFLSPSPIRLWLGSFPTYLHRTLSLSFCTQLPRYLVIHKRRISESKGFPESSVGKESACSAGDAGSIPGRGGSAGEGIGYLLLCSGLKNSMDCMVHGAAKSRTRRSAFRCHFLNRKVPSVTPAASDTADAPFLSGPLSSPGSKTPHSRRLLPPSQSPLPISPLFYNFLVPQCLRSHSIALFSMRTLSFGNLIPFYCLQCIYLQLFLSL